MILNQMRKRKSNNMWVSEDEFKATHVEESE